jgi:mRNA interferase MazF
MTTTVEDSSLLRAGDVVWVDLRPSRGREQGGVRPAVVLTDQGYHKRNDTAIVCPITSNKQPWPTKVDLPEGMPVKGVILVDQIRVLDRPTRGFRAVARIPEAVMEEVRAKLAALLGINRAP